MNTEKPKTYNTGETEEDLRRDTGTSIAFAIT